MKRKWEFSIKKIDIPNVILRNQKKMTQISKDKERT